MRKYNGVHYDLDKFSQTLKLKDFYHEQLLSAPVGTPKGFKKFGGSSIGNIFETDAYKGKFLAFLHMTRLSLPLFQKKYTAAGEAVEPKIFEEMKKANPALDIQHIEAAKVGYDYFKGVHDILGGVPDGIIPSKKIVLEMKAVQAKKQAIWEENNNSGVPLDYRKQAQLYAYLLGYNKYSIVAAFLEEQDYAKPELIDVTQRNIGIYSFSIEKAKVEDDIKEITDFFTHYSRTGISPQYDARRDYKVIEYLECHNEQEWEQLFNRWKRLGDIDEDIDFSQVR